MTRQMVLGAVFVLLNTLVTLMAVGAHEADQLRRNLEDNAIGMAHGLASAADENLRSYRQMLDVARLIYATHGGAPDENLAEVGRIGRLYGGYVTLTRDKGRVLQIVVPGDGSNPARTVEADAADPRYGELLAIMRRARTAGAYQISDGYRNPLLQIPVVTIATGALANGTGIDQLAIHLPLTVITSLLGQHQLEQVASAAVTDSHGVILARSAASRAFAGRQIEDWFLQARAGHEDGVIAGPRLPDSATGPYDLAFHRLAEAPGWYVTLAFPPGTLSPRFAAGMDTFGWAGLVMVLSSLIAWLAYGKELRAARLKRNLEAAAGRLLRGLPGALVELEQRPGAPPRMSVRHGLLAPLLEAARQHGDCGLLTDAIAKAASGGLPVDLDLAGRRLQIMAWNSGGGDDPLPLLTAHVADVTELREAEAAVLAASRLAAVGEIYASIAHEVSQPLNIISLAAENGAAFLIEGDGEAASAKFGSIVRQARKAREVIDRLLLFARGGTGPLALSAVPIETAVAQARELAAPRLAQYGVELTVEADMPDLAVRASAVELEHVFLNLLINAVDAVAANGDGQRRAIALRIRAKGEEEVLAEIEDTGGGIAEEVLAHVLSPLVTTKPPGSGTGLGLTYVRGAMRSFGGGVSIANGRAGAVVSLRFRRAGA